MPRDVHDNYFNQENNKDKYHLLDVSKGEDDFELDREESFVEEPVNNRRHAMHRPIVYPAPVRVFKMGTITETIEEDDHDKIMSSR